VLRAVARSRLSPVVADSTLNDQATGVLQP
jgi:hypothetical protein